MACRLLRVAHSCASMFVWNTTMNYPLTIMGSGGAIIDGGNTSQCMYIDTTNQPSDANSHVTIQNITFQNGNQPFSNGGALWAFTSSANVTVENCIFSNSTSQWGGGAQIVSPGSVIIRNNIFNGNVATNIDGGGISLIGNPISVLVENNIFYANRANVYGGAISVNTYGAVDFVNNVVYTNTATFGSVQITTADVANITNNTLTSNSGNGGGCLWVNLIEDTAISNIYNNIAWNQTGSIGGDIRIGDVAGDGNVGAVVNLYNNNFTDFFSNCSNLLGCTPRINQANNKSVDPLFVNVSDPDPANWNLRLSFGSECIDTGNNSTCLSKDIRGTPRPQDGDRNGSAICDMGAYEVMPVELSSFEGTIGTQIMLTGADFGIKKGKVLLGTVPAKIATDGWQTDSITCTVTKVPLPPGSFDITIKPQPYKDVLPIRLTNAFTVVNPEIDSGSADQHGAPGAEITLEGRFFSTKKGKVYIEYEQGGATKKKNCSVRYWYMDPVSGVSELRFVVPNGLNPATYTLRVTNKVGSTTTTLHNRLILMPKPRTSTAAQRAFFINNRIESASYCFSCIGT